MEILTIAMMNVDHVNINEKSFKAKSEASCCVGMYIIHYLKDIKNILLL